MIFLSKGRDNMYKIQEKVVAFEDAISRSRAKRLARGNILLQRGLFYTANEWQQKQQQHAEKLRRVSHRLYPEKY